MKKSLKERVLAATGREWLVPMKAGAGEGNWNSALCNLHLHSILSRRLGPPAPVNLRELANLPGSTPPFLTLSSGNVYNGDVKKVS